MHAYVYTCSVWVLIFIWCKFLLISLFFASVKNLFCTEYLHLVISNNYLFNLSYALQQKATPHNCQSLSMRLITKPISVLKEDGIPEIFFMNAITMYYRQRTSLNYRSVHSGLLIQGPCAHVKPYRIP